MAARKPDMQAAGYNQPTQVSFLILFVPHEIAQNADSADMVACAGGEKPDTPKPSVTV